MNRSCSLLLPFAVLLSSCAASSTDRVLATYPGGEITLTEWDAASPRRGSAGDPAAKLRQMALAERLARAALDADAMSTPGRIIELQRLDDRTWVKALEKQTRDATQPSEDDVQAYLEEHRHQLEKPRKLRLWNLFKRAPESSLAARQRVRREMERLLKRLEDGEDFNELAKAESEAVNRYRGGRMGAVPPGQLRQDVERIAFALAEGETSPVIPVPEGFVILRNSGIVEASTMSEEEAVERIRTAMARWNYDDAWEQLRVEMLSSGAELASVETIAAADAETIIGSMSGLDLTYGEIDAYARGLSKGRGAEPKRLTPFRIRAVLEAHLFQRLAAARARSLGLERDPGAVAKAHAQRVRLLAQGELERRARRQPLEIAELEVREFFDANEGFFQIPRLHDLSVIQLRLDEEAGTLRRKTLVGRETIERMRSGSLSFAAAASEVSEHPSAANGGRIGLKPRRWAAALGPNVLAAFDRLEPGGITGLIRQDDLWIVRLEGVEEGRSLTYEESRENARWGVEGRMIRARVQQLERELQADLDPQVTIVELPEVDDTEPGAPRQRNMKQRQAEQARSSEG
ncbi:MAG: peptidylprolyl isomerase [Acidobacteria bacterium]|nr:peptidylprolyl isomerase [Acidobacteriota bacterium]